MKPNEGTKSRWRWTALSLRYTRLPSAADSRFTFGLLLLMAKPSWNSSLVSAKRYLLPTLSSLFHQEGIPTYDEPIACAFKITLPKTNHEKRLFTWVWWSRMIEHISDSVFLPRLRSIIRELILIRAESAVIASAVPAGDGRGCWSWNAAGLLFAISTCQRVFVAEYSHGTPELKIRTLWV